MLLIPSGGRDGEAGDLRSEDGVLIITVLVADDHTEFRHALCRVLDGEPDIEVIAEAADGRSAVSLASELHPEVAVLDIVMPNTNGIEATRQIMAVWPDCRVIGVSLRADRRQIAEMIVAGAHSFVPKHAAVDDLIQAIRAASKGPDPI